MADGDSTDPGSDHARLANQRTSYLRQQRGLRDIFPRHSTESGGPGSLNFREAKRNSNGRRRARGSETPLRRLDRYAPVWSQNSTTTLGHATPLSFPKLTPQRPPSRIWIRPELSN